MVRDCEMQPQPPALARWMPMVVATVRATDVSLEVENRRDMREGQIAGDIDDSRCSGRSRESENQREGSCAIFHFVKNPLLIFCPSMFNGVSHSLTFVNPCCTMGNK
jgi:hypothetical protein